jgi:hypothetical protein
MTLQGAHAELGQGGQDQTLVRDASGDGLAVHPSREPGGQIQSGLGHDDIESIAQLPPPGGQIQLNSRRA